MKKTIILILILLFVSAPAYALVEIDQTISLWNLGGALVVIGGAWMTLKGRIRQIEERTEAHEKRLEDACVLAQRNEIKLADLKQDVYERLMDQERLLFERMNERIDRIEAKIDRLIERGKSGK